MNIRWCVHDSIIPSESFRIDFMCACSLWNWTSQLIDYSKELDRMIVKTRYLSIVCYLIMERRKNTLNIHIRIILSLWLLSKNFQSKRNELAETPSRIIHRSQAITEKRKDPRILLTDFVSHCCCKPKKLWKMLLGKFVICCWWAHIGEQLILQFWYWSF